FRCERVDSLRSNLQRLESLLTYRVRPTRPDLVEQAFVAAFQLGARKSAHSHHGGLQIAITESKGQRGLALQQGLPLIEAAADAAAGALAEPLTPVVHLVENTPLTAGDCLKCQRTGGGK